MPAILPFGRKVHSTEPKRKGGGRNGLNRREASGPMALSFKEGGRELDKIIAATIGLIIIILEEVLKDDDGEGE